MRTALWMSYLTSFSVFHGQPAVDESVCEEFDKWAAEANASRAKAGGEEKGVDFTLRAENGFRPIERLLGPDLGLEPNREYDNVLGAFVWGKMKGLRRGDFKKDVAPSDALAHVIATAWTSDRCIVAYTGMGGKEHIATIGYDEIVAIEAVPGKKYLLADQDGVMLLRTTTENIRFTSITFSGGSSDTLNNVRTFCAYATELVMKYKQARYAAQQAAAGAQAAPQAAPQPVPQAPQAAPQPAPVPQETVPQAVAPAAPPAGVGAQAEVIEMLKQFKELLDAGILTQEEFDAKKKQLLGL